MTEELEEWSGKLVVLRCWCGIQHAVPESLRNEQLRMFNDGKKQLSIYCPLGHEHVPIGKPLVDKIKRKLSVVLCDNDCLKDNLKSCHRSRSALRAVIARTKNKE